MAETCGHTTFRPVLTHASPLFMCLNLLSLGYIHRLSSMPGWATGGEAGS